MCSARKALPGVSQACVLHVTDMAEPYLYAKYMRDRKVVSLKQIASPREGTWRVFYTRARAEKRCEVLLHERNIEVFLPTQTVVRQWGDRKKKIVEPLFPNYIFAQVEEEGRLRVLQTPGIVRCVSFDGTPARMTDEEIEQLKIAQREPHRLRRLDVPMPTIGEEVTITEAPLRGLRGKVTEHRGQMHLIVQVAAIRQALRVQVPAEWVRTSRPAA